VILVALVYYNTKDVHEVLVSPVHKPLRRLQILDELLWVVLISYIWQKFTCHCALEYS
jgi:hypothetical protein